MQNGTQNHGVNKNKTTSKVHTNYPGSETLANWYSEIMRAINGNSASTKLQTIFDQVKNHQPDHPEVFKEVTAYLLTLTDAKGRNCLHLACLYAAERLVIQICEEFIKRQLKLDQRDKFSYTAMELACISFDETGKDQRSNQHQYSGGTTRFARTAVNSSARLHIVQYMVEKQRQKWNYSDYYHRSNPLHWAIVNGDAELAYYLVKHAPGFMELKDEKLLYPLRLPFEVIKGVERHQESRKALEQAITGYLEAEVASSAALGRLEPNQDSQIQPSVDNFEQVHVTDHEQGHEIKHETTKKPDLENEDANGAGGLAGMFQMADQEVGDQLMVKAKGKKQQELAHDDLYPDMELEYSGQAKKAGNSPSSPNSAQQRNTPRFIGGDLIKRDHFELENEVKGENQASNTDPAGFIPNEQPTENPSDFSKLPLLNKNKKPILQPQQPSRQLQEKEVSEFVDLFKLTKHHSSAAGQALAPDPQQPTLNPEPKPEPASKGVKHGFSHNLGKVAQQRPKLEIKIPDECKMQMYQTTLKKKTKFLVHLLNACVRLNLKNYVKYLLNKTVDPFVISICGANCLHAAAQEGRYGIMISLIKFARNKVWKKMQSASPSTSKIAPIKATKAVGNPSKQLESRPPDQEELNHDHGRSKNLSPALENDEDSKHESHSKLGNSNLPTSKHLDDQSLMLTSTAKELVYQSKEFQAILNAVTQDKIETALIIATKMVNYCDPRRKTHYNQIIKLLLTHKANVMMTDYKGWSVLNYYREPLLLQMFEEAVREENRQILVSNKGRTLGDVMQVHSFKYQLCIIAKATSNNPEDTLLCRQLINIRDSIRHIGVVSIKAFYGIFNNENKTVIYYVISFDDAIINYYVQQSGYTIFNERRGFHVPFIAGSAQEYEPVKEYYKRIIIMNLLLQEFDIHQYIEEKMIESVFDLHDFRKRKALKIFPFELIRSRQWKNYFTLQLSPAEIRYSTAVANYSGCLTGLVHALILHFSISLVVPALPGIATLLLDLILSNNSIWALANLLNSIILTVWIPYTFIRWVQTQSKLAYLWSTHFYDMEERIRFEYRGSYLIDPDSKEITEETAVSGAAKRMLVEPIVLPSAAVISIMWFILIIRLKGLISDKDIYKTVYSILISILNGTGIAIINKIYLVVTGRIVNWENHKYQSSSESSLVLKNFTFQFFNSYIYLVYALVVRVGDYDPVIELGFTVSSNLASYLLMTFFLPYAIYRYKKYKISKKWSEFNTKFYEPYLIAKKVEQEAKAAAQLLRNSPNKMFTGQDDDSSSRSSNDYTSSSDSDERSDHKHKQIFAQDGPGNMEQLLDKGYKVILTKEILPSKIVKEKITDYDENDRILHQQIEHTLGQTQPTNPHDVFSVILVNYGYCVFFVSIFPVSSILVLLVYIVLSYFIIWKSTIFTMRARPLPASSIGVWIFILKAMSFISLITNPMLIWYYLIRNKSRSVTELFGVKKAYWLPIAVFIEHLLFFAAFFTIKYGSKQDQWLKDELQKEESNLELEKSQRLRETFEKNKRVLLQGFQAFATTAFKKNA